MFVADYLIYCTSVNLCEEVKQMDGSQGIGNTTGPNLHGLRNRRIGLRSGWMASIVAANTTLH